MKFGTVLLSYDVGDIVPTVKAAEELGFEGFWVSETNSDPFIAMTLAAEHSTSIELGTGIVVAFPRSPTILAHTAWDLARLSNGRFTLGLGTQVRAHNERRFGVKWEKPVTKMRETVLAIRALWDNWQNGTPLKVEGEFFNLDLMTPFFTPKPLDNPDIPIYIAAVNENMLKLVGEVCDGVFLHSIHSVEYIRDFALPNIKAGAEKTGRNADNIKLTTGVFAIPTDDPKQAAMAEGYVRQQISFYMSTPAYRVVAEMHGWEDISLQLSKMARKGEWKEMIGLVPDDMLDVMAVRGKWAELPGIISEKYGNLLDSVSYYLPFEPGQADEGWKATIEGFKALDS